MMHVVTDRRGETVGVVDAPSGSAALDAYARRLGYEDSGAMWAAQGPFQGRVYRWQPGHTKDVTP
jgi:hypothetical protein